MFARRASYTPGDGCCCCYGAIGSEVPRAPSILCACAWTWAWACAAVASWTASVKLFLLDTDDADVMADTSSLAVVW